MAILAQAPANWVGWGEWSRCPEGCDTGNNDDRVRFRTRKCDPP